MSYRGLLPPDCEIWFVPCPPPCRPSGLPSLTPLRSFPPSPLPTSVFVPSLAPFYLVLVCCFSRSMVVFPPAPIAPILSSLSPGSLFQVIRIHSLPWSEMAEGEWIEECLKRDMGDTVGGALVEYARSAMRKVWVGGWVAVWVCVTSFKTAPLANHP